MRLGPTFGDQLRAAGLDLPISWSETGEIQGLDRLTSEQRTRLDQEIAVHDPNRRPVPTIPLATIQARMKAETVGTADGWSTYVDFMLPVGTLTALQKARRNAFLETMFAGLPIRQDNTAFRKSLTDAGFTTAQADRVLATP